MKAICIHKFVRDYREIKVSEVSQPQPKDGEVLVHVAAAGVNYVDLLYCRGKHQNNRSLVHPPFNLGLEFAGTVTATRSSKFLLGDRVFGGSLGAYAEFICVPNNNLQHIPKQWDFVSAASLGATVPVSYGALVIRGELKKGETVLIHASARGLGLCAVQIAKAIGTRVIATASTQAKLDIAKKFGADACINYTTNPFWAQEVFHLTHNHGVDLIYDPVGLINPSLKCLKQRGRILIVGFAGREGNLESVAMNKVLLKQAKLIGYRFGMTDRMDPAETVEIWKGVGGMLEKGLLKPTVFDTEYNGLDNVVRALEDLSARRVWGKAVIRIAPEVPKTRL